jgi:hypothetical protein
MTGELLARSAACGALALVLLTGCNAITGSGDLMVVGAGAGKPTGSAAGAGGAGGGHAMASSSSSMATMCTYPPAPATGYGVGQGDVVPPHLHWTGYADGSTVTSTPTTIQFDDYYDCDGSKGINAVLVDTSALWCGACQQGAAGLDGEIKASWAALGIKVITLIVNGINPNAAATIADVLTWKKMFDLDTSTVVLDAQFTFLPPNTMTVGLPVEIVLDPRTMKITDDQQGYSGDYTTLTTLAQQNKGK